MNEVVEMAAAATCKRMLRASPSTYMQARRVGVANLCRSVSKRLARGEEQCFRMSPSRGTWICRERLTATNHRLGICDGTAGTQFESLP